MNENVFSGAMGQSLFLHMHTEVEKADVQREKIQAVENRKDKKKNAAWVLVEHSAPYCGPFQSIGQTAFLPLEFKKTPCICKTIPLLA